MAPWGELERPAIDPVVDAMAVVVGAAHDVDVLIAARAPAAEVLLAVRAMHVALDAVRDLVAAVPS